VPKDDNFLTNNKQTMKTKSVNKTKSNEEFIDTNSNKKNFYLHKKEVMKIVALIRK
jgi:hypothetical protein